MAVNYRKLNEDYAELEAIKNRLTGENFEQHDTNLVVLFYQYLTITDAEKAERKVKKVVKQIDEIQKRIKETIEAKFKQGNNGNNN